MMPGGRLPAVLMRGGTSKALMLHRRDLPERREAWTPLLLAAMGSPDAYGRQLNGMGGGVSSLSKVCVIGPPSRPDADVDYTFAQVLIREPRVDYRGNCGNMSAAIGPFAVDENLLPDVSISSSGAAGPQAKVRIHNTNTGKLIVARFPLRDGRTRYDGELSIPGVGGTGSAIRLEFLDPGGATTGRLLPAGGVRESLDVAGVGNIEVSMIDAANSTVFVRACDLGLSGTELPDAIEHDTRLMGVLNAIRCSASVAMGIAPNLTEAAKIALVPYLVLVAPPQTAEILGGDALYAEHCDITARALAAAQAHRALPLTVSLCLAVAARIEGSLVNEMLTREPEPGVPLRIGMPSGVLTVDADVRHENGTWIAKTGAFYRTARRLFSGHVYLD
jgi:2-methylaconitate cis-trans-isomerase PrpF